MINLYIDEALLEKSFPELAVSIFSIKAVIEGCLLSEICNQGNNKQY